MDWKQSADELYNELQREKRRNTNLENIINDILVAYRNGSGDELDEVLDKHFSNETDDLIY